MALLLACMAIALFALASIIILIVEPLVRSMTDTETWLRFSDIGIPFTVACMVMGGILGFASIMLVVLT